MTSKVAKLVADACRREGCPVVGWGDSWVLDTGAGDLVKVKNDHPLNRMRAVFAHLDRSPELFQKGYRRSMNSRGAEVVVRTFRLIKQKDTPSCSE